MDIDVLYIIGALLLGWIADLLFGDPQGLPHPIVGFGKVIARGEKWLNKGENKMLKGACFALILIVISYLLICFLLRLTSEINPLISVVLSAIIIFYCLAGKTLITEVRQVFIATESSVEEGRTQVARIVGRDTSALSPQQIKKAALETLSENLSDGVIAPLFWLLLLGVPGIFAYKMINTLDSMIGYKNDRYQQFGCWAARIDDVANYIPARLTAVLMILVSGQFKVFSFVHKFARKHLSPNSGYPESALAGILDCQFGGTHTYFDKEVEKPLIGENDRALTFEDMIKAVQINRLSEVLMIGIVIGVNLIVNFIF